MNDNYFQKSYYFFNKYGPNSLLEEVNIKINECRQQLKKRNEGILQCGMSMCALNRYTHTHTHTHTFKSTGFRSQLRESSMSSHIDEF